MNILYILPKLPYPILNGFNLRFYNICNELKNRGHKLYLVCFKNENQNPINLIRKLHNKQIFNKILLLNKEKSNFLKLVLENIFFFLNIRKKKYQNILDCLYREYHFEIIHYGVHYKALNHIFKFGVISKYPKVIDFVDSITPFLKKRYYSAPKLYKKLIRFLEYIYYNKIENHVIKLWKCILVVSPKDKRILDKGKSNSNVFVIPNGVNYKYFYPVKVKEQQSSIILFHGTMAFEPNQESVKYIIKDVLPLIKRRISDIKLYIVGKDPPSDIKKLGEGNEIVITGFVDDIREYIAKADVILEPAFGTGIKNKLLEAMAMGKAIVTNQIGIEALSYNARKAMLIGKDKYEMANHVIKLLNDEELRKQLGNEARNVILKEYTWEIIVKKYENLYKNIINKSF